MYKQNPVVLVVDRESDPTKALISYLRQNNLDVVWMRDGESAFNVLDDRPVDCMRSEERRVGKECRSRWSPYH